MMDRLREIISEEIRKMVNLNEYANEEDSNKILSYAQGLQEIHDRIIKEHPEYKHEITILKLETEIKNLQKLANMVSTREKNDILKTKTETELLRPQNKDISLVSKPKKRFGFFGK